MSLQIGKIPRSEVHIENSLINTQLSHTLEVWLNHFMPWIRETLEIENDDERIVEKWIRDGVTNTKIAEPVLKNGAICLAPGPSLENVLGEVVDVARRENFALVAADGAARALLDMGSVPDLVFTDADGLLPVDLKKMASSGVLCYVLAHGDNTDRIQTLIDYGIQMQPNVIWCTQGRPVGNWMNYYGFTDGDRAVSFVSSKQHSVYLVGYDLRVHYRGRYSRPPYKNSIPMNTRKKVKMRIAYTILEWINYNHPLFTMDSSQSPGTQLPLDEFVSMIANSKKDEQD